MAANDVFHPKETGFVVLSHLGSVFDMSWVPGHNFPTREAALKAALRRLEQGKVGNAVLAEYTVVARLETPIPDPKGVVVME